MGFQHRVEQDLDFVEKLAEKTKYSERIGSYAQEILTKLTSQTIVDKVQVYPDFDPFAGPKSVNAYGVIPTLKLASSNLARGDWANFKLICQVAADVFRKLPVNLIEFEEEMRHIGTLTIFPIERKVALKSRLLSNDFGEVVVSLEQAESSLEKGIIDEGSRKNCISRSRDAIECFVAAVRLKVTKEKTESKFFNDIKKLVEFGYMMRRQ